MKPMLAAWRSEGFALPTVILASVIMLVVLTTAVTAVGSITTSLAGQYYNQLAREASESGLAKARACLRASNYVATWSNAAPLRPNTDCNGTVLGTVSQYIVNFNNIRSTFSIGAPTTGGAGYVRVSVSSTVELTRTSNSQVWRSFSYSATENSRYNDTPQIASGAGWKESGHNGYMLASSGVLYGWGDNTSSQLGDSSLGATVSTPVKVALPSGVSWVKKVYSSGQGASTLCVLATHSSLGDQVYCRGSGGLGGVTWQRFGLTSGLTAIDMSLQGYGVNDGGCVLASDSHAYCAGENTSGNLGNGTLSSAFVPMSAPTKFRLDLASPGPVSGSATSLTVQKVFMQDRFTCVIASDSQAYCAGDNNYGQLGQGTFTTNVWIGKSIPGRVLIPGDVPVVETVHTYHSVAGALFFLGANQMVYMSGHNGQGTAADGATSGASCGGVNCYNIPRSISATGFGKILSIGERGDTRHAICILATAPVSDSGAWCIGANDYGEIGYSPCGGNTSGYYGAANLQGEIANYLMNPESTYQMNSAAIITTLGNVYAAGDNTYGKLGRGGALTSCNSAFGRVLLPAGVRATALANGDEYTMFILGDNGRVYAMGRNNNGQLGDGTTTDRSTPVEVKIPRQEIVY